MSSDCDSVYRDLFIDIYKNPKNFGKLEEYDVKESNASPACGDNITIYLKVENGKVKDISFEGEGCVISIVSASVLTQNVKGENIEKIKNMDAKELFDLIGVDLKNNPSRAKCALLSLNTLKKAIEKVEDKSKS